MLRRTFLLGSTALACATAPQRPPASPLLGHYTSSPWSFSTASYWIEGPDGVVVIDTQFLASDAQAVIAAAERETGKRVVAAIVLHPNPDKFNGTATFQRHGARVLTSASVLAEVPSVHAQRLEAFGQRYAPDFPVQTPQPEAFGDVTTALDLGGLPLTLHVLGPGCGAAHVAVQWQDHLFVGDLVANHAHAWMELGLVDAWLERLRELEGMGAAHVHPGRGPSSGPGLLSVQRDYLLDVAARVERAVAQSPADPESAKARVIAEIVEAYPEHRFAVFLEVGMPALWRRAVARAG